MSEWTDPDGNSLGEWEEIPREEYWEIFKRERDDLTVFSTLTDPEGNYGIRQIYTAWGYKEEDVPLIDIRDYKTEDGGLERQICRKFVSATCPNREAVSRPSTEDSGLSIDSLGAEGGNPE